MELVFSLLFMLRGGRSSGKRDIKSFRLDGEESGAKAGGPREGRVHAVEVEGREGLDLGRWQEAGGSVQGWRKKAGFI